MPFIKNVSPFGALEVPAFGLTVSSGESVKVSQEAFDSLIQQPFHWAPDNAPVTPSENKE